jgi:hypothetical protein
MYPLFLAKLRRYQERLPQKIAKGSEIVIAEGRF